MLKIVNDLRFTGTTRWSNYSKNRGYTAKDLSEKSDFVRSACERSPIGHCWDVGANDGHFSRIAAENAKLVLALDSDLGALEGLYQNLAGETDIMPLYQNFADPSPGLGWRNLERRRLEDRSKPDMILLLAVIHHLVIGSNIPLEELMDELARLNCRLVIEFVNREDPMVTEMLKAKGERFEDYCLDNFETCILKHFQLIARTDLPSGNRIMFELSPAGNTVSV
jgi:hypothetical protein